MQQHRRRLQMVKRTFIDMLKPKDVVRKKPAKQIQQVVRKKPAKKIH